MISFIIPAYNEAYNIGRLINNIKCVVSDLEYEIIVSDNGSLDATVCIAEGFGVCCLITPDVTIGTLRNIGARQASGDMLIFLDADMELTSRWSSTYNEFEGIGNFQEKVVTGCEPSIPDDATWIEECWHPFVDGKAHFCDTMSTGHFIIRKKFFDQLGGFDETLEVGEDLDLSRRAVVAGGKIINNPGLKAIHLGFPKTLTDFFRNQRWYGKQTAFISYKVFAMMVSNVIALVTTLLFVKITLWAIPMYLLFFYLLSVIIGFARTKQLSAHGTVLGGTYLIARTIGLFDILLKTKRKKGTRRRT